MQHYLGPDRPLASLSTWDAVCAAAEGGLLGENQWCELKQDLGPRGKKTNRELARDLASLSVYGGVLIFGVVDKTYEVVGCDVTGMRDRIAQVAATAISPPLTPVVLDPLEGPDGSSVLIVSVPPSPLAPHMVDERYYGRSAVGKMVLADPEVRTLILARKAGDEEFTSRLLDLAKNDPLADIVEDGPSRNGHAFFRAEPCGPVPTNAVEGLELDALVLGLHHGRQLNRTLLRGCVQPSNDPDGISLRSRYGTVLAASEHFESQVSVHDDHAISAVSGGASRFVDTTLGEHHKSEVGIITAFAAQFVELVLEVSRSWGYQGEWRVGAHLNGIKGSTRSAHDFAIGQSAFPYAECTNSLVITPMAWGDDPNPEIGGTAVQLLVKLLRGLGIETREYRNIVSRG